MTQTQHIAIAKFLTEHCHLIETPFIEEMSDHFADSVEEKMACRLSFKKALELTLEEFGGAKNLQKMEWTYRKQFFKREMRTWWKLVKRQFAMAKLLRTLLVVGFITVASLNYRLVSDFLGTSNWKAVSFTPKLWSLVLGVMLTLFLLQPFFPSFKKIGVVQSPTLFKTLLCFLHWATLWLLYVSIDAIKMPMHWQGFAYATMWSIFAVLFLGYLDYVQKTNPDSKYYQLR
ncbi:hypothetical protein Q0590_36815 [Rhodocytophaga aerolata]|uniref:YihY/virulence factor BrkB family protein n=1 Tax=Rhodocytophaga aerolata TaxID=455078 RepID=A0ABT8RIH9_9BACT|nr:hypothetical protein [Rhodocytophaga aerolata]MDO1451890.1 hypothetical protein [Rhodocytophaga aerolata]